ncbi:hypothetical protein Q3G72_005242 [Acer saccharum]|nr:hypothetical protein Q3G72_005242 [Acer saccharum]
MKYDIQILKENQSIAASQFPPQTHALLEDFIKCLADLKADLQSFKKKEISAASTFLVISQEVMAYLDEMRAGIKDGELVCVEEVHLSVVKFVEDSAHNFGFEEFYFVLQFHSTNFVSITRFSSLAPKTKNVVVAGGLTAFVFGVYFYTMRAVGGTDELQAAIDKFEGEKNKKET